MVRVALAVSATSKVGLVVTVMTEAIMGCIFLRLGFLDSCLECDRYTL
jgi:hypothetical protein